MIEFLFKFTAIHSMLLTSCHCNFIKSKTKIKKNEKMLHADADIFETKRKTNSEQAKTMPCMWMNLENKPRYYMRM